MISTTYAGSPAWLVNEWPEWPLSVSFDIPTVVQEGETLREERRAFAEKIRASMSWTGTVFGTEIDSVRAAIQALDERTILVPFWPATELQSEIGAASMQGGLRVWWEPGWFFWEIGTGSAPTGFTPTAKCLTAPLMAGRWDSMPKLKPRTPRMADVSFSFLESGEASAALTAKAVSLTAGTSGHPMLGVPINWKKLERSAEIKIDHDRIGYLRSEVETYIPHTARETQVVEALGMGSNEVAQLMRLFEDRLGNVRPWWCPAAGEVSAAPILVRLKSSKLKVTWEKPAIGGREVAYASLSVVALPSEASVPVDEVLGSTLGALPTTWWGYVVTDETRTFRFTSFERDIDAGALGVFAHAPIEHGDRTVSTTLEANDLKLTIGAFDGSPFEELRIHPNRKFKVQVYEGALSSPGSASLIATGTLSSVSFSGVRMTASISSGASLFDEQIPLAVAGPRCWVDLFSGLCGVSRAAKSVSADLQAVVGGKLRFVQAGGSTFPATAADEFRYGYATRTHLGVVERYSIAGSAAATGSSYLEVSIVGATDATPSSGWTLVPGCDKSFDRCKALGGKFRGFPHFPKSNPALVPLKQSTASGSKK